MAMNIGEIKHGSIIIPGSDSGKLNTRIDWIAERTSATTTDITTIFNYILVGSVFSNGDGAPDASATINIDGKSYSLNEDTRTDISYFNQRKRYSLPKVKHTITHTSSGIENFTLQLSSSFKFGATYNYTADLAQTTIDLNSAKIAKVFTTNTTQYTKTNYRIKLKLIYDVVEQSIQNNYSDIEAILFFSFNYDTSAPTGGSNVVKFKSSISIDGVSTTLPVNYLGDLSCGEGKVTPSGGTTYYEGGDIYLGNTTARIYHTSDGSKDFNIIAKCGGSLTTPYATINLTETLPTIPRAAKILTAPNFTDEDNPTITYSNPAGSMATSIQAAISLDGTTADMGWKDLSKAETSYTFNLTDDERNTLRAAANSAATIKVWFLLKTVLYGNILTESAERTLSIVSCNPILNSEVVDVDAATLALTGDPYKLIKFYSDAQASLNATMSKGATLAYFEIKNGANYGNTQVFTFNNVENNKFEFLVRDSRGNIATKVVTPTMVEYIKLTCNLDSNLPDTSGNYDIRVTGNYFNGSFGAVDNTLTVQYRIKTENGSYGSWVTMATTFSDGTYEATARATGLDYRAAYVVQIKAADKLTEITTDERKIKTTPVFSWSESDFEFNTEVRINGDLRLKGDGNYGNTLYFGDGSYAYMREGTDDDLTFKATDLTLEATNLYLSGSSQVQINGSILPNMETGTWDAVLGSSAAVSSYNSRSGWYVKIGNVVTIGWNVDATCNSGYQSTAIKIAGAPYFPSVSAAGGGILYGAYTTGGLAFEGWVIEESGGAITPRLQPCNNTAAANLNISSTAYYPNGGGNLKCFGSLTYITDN